MNSPPINESLASAKIDTLQEILRQAETYLQAQLTAAIAADQRAMTLAGYLATSIAVLLGASGALLLATPPNWLLALTGFLVAGLFLRAMRMAIKAGEPSDFEFPGNTPGSWVCDISEKKSLEVSLSEQCAHYHEMSEANRIFMKENGNRLREAIAMVFRSLVAGGVLFAMIVIGQTLIGASAASG
jgi:hypothetical protein